MLFPVALHERIRGGEVTLAFRRWKKPQARAGARHRFGAEGVLAIADVRQVTAAKVTDADARSAGYPDSPALRADLERHGGPLESDERVYRIEFRFEREDDPRARLAVTAALNADEADAIAARLAKMDQASRHGPWTRAALEAIERNPGVVSTRLAAMLGRERMSFKQDVRKLKALGLTISHEVGYEISPRGRAFLAQARASGRVR